MDPTILDRLLAISELFARDTQRAFAGTSLTQPRIHALWVLHHTGPQTQRALSRVLGITPRSVSSLVDGLESTGYVVRKPHPSDRRATLVTLTEQAESLMSGMSESHSRLNATLIAAVAEPDRDAFERGVDAVFWRLNELVRGPAERFDAVERDRGETGSEQGKVR